MSSSRRNAFQLNRLHGWRGLFPLSFAWHGRGEGIYTAVLFPQRVIDLAIVLGRSGGRVCMFGVDHVSGFTPHERRALSITEIARRAGVAAVVLDRDTLVLPIRELGRLLDEFDHFQLELLDLPEDLDEAGAIERAVLASEDRSRLRERPVLLRQPTSRFYLHSHDDCYLYIESRSQALILEVLGVLLATYLATIVGHAVAAPPEEVSRALLQPTGALSILDANTRWDGRQAQVGVATEAFAPSEEREYSVLLVLLLDDASGNWSVRPMSDSLPAQLNGC